MLALNNCYIIIFQQDLKRNSEIKEKLENLKIEPIPIVIYLNYVRTKSHKVRMYFNLTKFLSCLAVKWFSHLLTLLLISIIQYFCRIFNFEINLNRTSFSAGIG